MSNKHIPKVCCSLRHLLCCYRRAQKVSVYICAASSDISKLYPERVGAFCQNLYLAIYDMYLRTSWILLLSQLLSCPYCKFFLCSGPNRSNLDANKHLKTSDSFHERCNVYSLSFFSWSTSVTFQQSPSRGPADFAISVNNFAHATFPRCSSLTVAYFK